jgi:hypothetical protein
MIGPCNSPRRATPDRVLLRNWRAASGTVEGHADHARRSVSLRKFGLSLRRHRDSDGIR